MKKHNKIAMVATLLIILGFGGFFLVKDFIPGAVTDISSDVQLVSFTHGVLKCEPISSSIEESGSTLIRTYPTDISCQKTFKVTTDTCDIKLRLEDDIFVERKFSYEICDISGNLYTSTSYSNCVAGDALSNDIFDDVGSSSWYKDEKGSVYLLRGNFPSSKVLRITSIKSVFSFSDDEDLFSAFVTYQPYGLRKYDTLQGSYTTQTDNCISIPSNIQDRLLIQTTDSSEYNKLFNSLNYMYANEIFDYVSLPVVIPFTTERLKEIGGKYAYCKNTDTGSISAYYGLESVTTFDNHKYYYISDDILQSDVECCNGDVKLGYYCQDEQWVQDSVPQECSITNPCKVQFDTRYGEKQVYHQDCINNVCENIVKNVECTQSSDCTAQDGGICRADFTCFYRDSSCSKNSECLSGQICEDGKCIDDEQSTTTYVWWILGGLAVIFGIAIILSFTGRKPKF